jgi:hypothetical protein
VKQIVGKFKIGKTQIYDILNSKSDIKREWLTGNGSMKGKLKMTRNENKLKILWDWYDSVGRVGSSGKNYFAYFPYISRELFNIYIDKVIKEWKWYSSNLKESNPNNIVC